MYLLVRRQLFGLSCELPVLATARRRRPHWWGLGSISAPTGSTRGTPARVRPSGKRVSIRLSAGRNRRQRSATYRCRRSSSTRCANGNSLARRANSGWCAPDGQGKVESLGNIVNRGADPRASPCRGDGRHRQARRRGQASARHEVYRPARPTAFLCLLVHQPAGRRRARAPREGCVGTARAFLNRDDDGHLRAPLFAGRRRRRIGRRRERASPLSAI